MQEAVEMVDAINGHEEGELEQDDAPAATLDTLEATRAIVAEEIVRPILVHG